MMMASVAALSLPTRQGSSITTKMITSMQSLGSSLRLVSLLECFHWADTGWIQHADADRRPYCDNMMWADELGIIISGLALVIRSVQRASRLYHIMLLDWMG